MMTDPYGVLGVRADVSDEELAKVYKKLAKRYHPDLNPGNQAAAERMGQINQAYDQIKTMRQTGNRQNSDAAYRNPGYGSYSAYSAAADPFRDFYSQYRRYNETQRTNYYPPRRGSSFRLMLTVILAMLLLRVFAALLGFTTPMQKYVSQQQYNASSEMPYAYYDYGTHLYP